MRRKTTERILGIDPGIARTGFGIIERRGSVTTALVYGCIETSSTAPYGDRLLTLANELTRILRKYRPTACAIEKLFFLKNRSSAFAVGQARGVILLTLRQHHLTPREFTPQHVKSAVAGYGKAGKEQIQRMMQILLHLKSVPKPDDVADALAVALTAASWNDARAETSWQRN